MEKSYSNQRYVAYVMYPPATNKKIMEDNIDKFEKHLNELSGELGEKDFCSVNLPEEINKKNSCELSMFYFTVPKNQELKENLAELLRTINPKYNDVIMRMQYLSVDHTENYLYNIKNYFHKV